jgi:hypothetical protein
MRARRGIALVKFSRFAATSLAPLARQTTTSRVARLPEDAGVSEGVAAGLRPDAQPVRPGTDGDPG